MFAVTAVTSAAASCLGVCACQGCAMLSKQLFQRSARVGYCIFFTLAMFLAWLLRDFPPPIQKIPWIHVPESAEEKFFGQQAVFRISLANTLFFGALSLALLGVKLKSDPRDQAIHHGHWVIKVAAWLGFSVISFVLPTPVVNGYGMYIAPIGSIIFVIIQMIILVDMAQTWNDSWVEKGEEDNRWLWALLAVTVGAYIGVIAIIVGLFVFFKPADVADACSLNVFLITLTILIIVGMTATTLHPGVRAGSLFPAAVVSLYCAYLALSALQSEPDEVCNGLYKRKLSAASGSTMLAGIFVAIIAVVYSALRAGSNTDTFTLAREEAAEEAAAQGQRDLESRLLYDGKPSDAPEQATAPERAAEGESRAIDAFEPVPYNYSFFHAVFAAASMYLGMLLTGWGGAFEPTGIMDFGWKAMWVKFGTQWATAALYLWILAAPVLMPDRDFS